MGTLELEDHDRYSDWQRIEKETKLALESIAEKLRAVQRVLQNCSLCHFCEVLATSDVKTVSDWLDDAAQSAKALSRFRRKLDEFVPAVKSPDLDNEPTRPKVRASVVSILGGARE